MNKISEKKLLDEIKGDTDLSGKFGEAIGEAWLQSDGWDYFDLNEKGLIEPGHWIYRKNAKKADQIGAHDEHEDAFVIWDQKFHTLYDDCYFKLNRKDLDKYKEFIKICRSMSDEDDFYLFFMFFPKIHDGKRMYLVDISQFFTDGKNARFGENPAVQVKIKEEDCYDTSKHQNTVLKNWK